MTQSPRVLGVITARSGSKGLPDKNIRELAGRPLIAHTVEAALGLGQRLTRLVVSTDDPAIADAAVAAGAEAPFLRPLELAQDNTASLPVVQHTIEFVEAQEQHQYDWILLLQPTSPLRTSADLHSALNIAFQDEASSVISVCTANEYHPLKMKVISGNILAPYDSLHYREGMRRQDYSPEVYRTNGAVYLSRRDKVMLENSLLGDKPAPLLMPAERSVDIDSLLDFQLAEFILQKDY